MSTSKNISTESTPTITPRLRPKTRHQHDHNDGEGDDAVVPLSSLSIGTKRGRAASSGKADSGTTTTATRIIGSGGGGGDTPVSTTRDTSQAHQHIRGGEWVERRLASVPMVPLTVPFTVGCVSVNEKAPTTGEVQQLEERRKRLGLSAAAAASMGYNMETTKTTGEHKERTHRFYVYVAPTASFSDSASSSSTSATSPISSSIASSDSSSSMEDTLAALFYAMVDRVEFVLNPSFQYRRRVCRTPPFVIQENAWGESVIDVVVFLKRSHQHIPQSLGSGCGGPTPSSSTTSAKKKRAAITAVGIKNSYSNEDTNDSQHLFTSPPDAALPIKASKMVRSFVGSLNLATSSSSSLSTGGGGGDVSEGEKILYYLPTARGSTTATTSSSSAKSKAKSTTADKNTHGGDAEEEIDDEDTPEEVDTVNVSGLNDADTQYTTFLMSETEEKDHSEGLESTIIARIRSHLQRPVVDSQTHPALPALRMVPSFSSVPLVPHSVTRELITSSSSLLSSEDGGGVDPGSLVLEDRLRNFDAKFVKQFVKATAAKADVTSPATATTTTSVDDTTTATTASETTSAALKHLTSIPPVSFPTSNANSFDNMDRLLVFDDRRDAPVVNERLNGITIYCSVPSLVNKELSEDYAAIKQRGNNKTSSSSATSNTTATHNPPSPKHKASAQLLKWVQRFIAEGLEQQRRRQMLMNSSDAVEDEYPHPLLAPIPRLPSQVRELVAAGGEVAMRSFSAINVAPPTPVSPVKAEVAVDIPPPPQTAISSAQHQQPHMQYQSEGGGVHGGIACPAAAHLAQYILRLMEEERELMRRFVEVDTAVSELWEPMAADLITSIAQQLKSETYDAEPSTQQQ